MRNGRPPWRARRRLDHERPKLADALAPLGAEIFELPMTPERLFRLIEKTRAQAPES